MSWEAGLAVDHFEIMETGATEATSRVISSTEAAAGEAWVENLKSFTEYTITIYNENNPRGSQTVTIPGLEIESTISDITANSAVFSWEETVDVDEYACAYQVLDFTADFRAQIIEKFIRVYEAGGTPNPCIDCNKYMKFRHLLDWAEEHGMEYVVTGHYARVEQDAATGRWLLKKGLDEGKDQSYVLYNLTQEQLAHIRLPLGALHKTEVREIAQEHSFINAQKHDSQDICFVPDGDYARFMEQFTGKHYPAGDFLDRSGKVVGTHSGAVRYTLGQRKGLGLALGAPVYVCGKDMQANTVTVGPESELFDRIVYAEDVNWIAIPALTEPLRVTARTRYHQAEQQATVYPAENGFRLEFDQPQRAPTPGQAAVLYQGDVVLGGGTITRVEK